MKHTVGWFLFTTNWFKISAGRASQFQVGVKPNVTIDKSIVQAFKSCLPMEMNPFETLPPLLTLGFGFGSGAAGTTSSTLPRPSSKACKAVPSLSSAGTSTCLPALRRYNIISLRCVNTRERNGHDERASLSSPKMHTYVVFNPDSIPQKTTPRKNKFEFKPEEKGSRKEWIWIQTFKNHALQSSHPDSRPTKCTPERPG